MQPVLSSFRCIPLVSTSYRDLLVPNYSTNPDPTQAVPSLHISAISFTLFRALTSTLWVSFLFLVFT